MLGSSNRNRTVIVKGEPKYVLFRPAALAMTREEPWKSHGGVEIPPVERLAFFWVGGSKGSVKTASVVVGHVRAFSFVWFYGDLEGIVNIYACDRAPCPCLYIELHAATRKIQGGVECHVLVEIATLREGGLPPGAPSMTRG